MAESLLLDNYNNNSNYDKKIGFGECPNAGFYSRVIVHDKDGNDRDITTLVGCKNWSCPVCKKKNAWKLRKKSANAITDYLNEIKIDGFRFQYFAKFLTLTLPGREFRENYSIDEADKIIKKNWNNLRTALKKKYGNFEYLWVDEAHKDGYPHLHVMLIGKEIASKAIYEDIKSLWQGRYGMGFVWIRKVDGGIKQIASYISKYVSKELGEGRKYSRVYSMSKKLRTLFKLEKMLITVVEFGRVITCPDGTRQFQVIWCIDDVSDFERMMAFVEKNMDEIKADVHVQLKLPF